MATTNVYAHANAALTIFSIVKDDLLYYKPWMKKTQ